jgi:4-amino-4-deoxy-L-arabinose transferase-like glycosyltransferase
MPAPAGKPPVRFVGYEGRVLGWLKEVPTIDRSARLRAAVVLSLVMAVLVLPTLGQRPIATSDEARFALLAQQLLDRDAWTGVEVRGHVYRKKPLLYPLSIATVSRLQGRVTEVTAQAPVALAALGAVLFTFLLGERLFGPRAGLWAGLVLATMYGFVRHTHALLPDMLVVCFVMAAGLAFWSAVARPPGRVAMALFYAAMALAVFSKGPVGLLPLLAGAGWLLSEERLRGLRRLWSPLGIGLFALVTLAWLLPYVALDTGYYVHRVVWADWLGWYGGGPTLVSVTSFLGDGLLGTLPWTPVLVVAGWQLWARRSRPAERFVLLWLLVPLCALALSSNQRTRYLLPLYPALALLIARWADDHVPRATRGERRLAWGVLAVSGLGLLALAGPDWLVPGDGPDFLDTAPWSTAFLAAGVLAGAGMMFRGLRTGRPALLVYGVAAAALVVLGYGNWLAADTVRRTEDFGAVAAEIDRHANGGDVGAFGGRFYQLDFYLGRPVAPIRSVEEFTAYLDRPEQPLVVLNGRTWARIQSQIDSQAMHVLAQTSLRGQDFLVLRRATGTAMARLD